MKKTAIGVLALAGTLFVQLAGAGPGTAAERRVITKTVTTGDAFVAEYDYTDGCIRTWVSVFGGVFTVRGKTAPAPEKLGFVSVTQDNTCTGTTLINGSGETSTLNLVVPNALAKGHLRMTIEFTDYASDNPVVSQLTADLSYRATGKANKTSTKSRIFSEGTRVVSSAATKSRPVSVTGTITLGAQKVVSPNISPYFTTVATALNKEKTTVRIVK
jgi:hypothetical protein